MSVHRSPILALAILFHLSWPAFADGPDWISVITRNRAATVLLKVETGSGTPSFGSGTVIGKDGYILTAAHVVGTPETVNSPAFGVSGLVGWSEPSVDFSQAHDLVVDYVSTDETDVAVLHFARPAPPHGSAVPAGAPPPDGTDIILMGYPGGGNLTSTQGIAAGAGPDGRIKADARVAKGNSGCGVFDGQGRLVGMLIEGSRSKDDGSIELGYFLTVAKVADHLKKNGVGFRLDDAGVAVAEADAPPPVVALAYPVDDTKSDHDAVRATSQGYSHSFQAQAGYRIVSASFAASSANNVVGGPDVTVAGDGSAVTVAYTLRSGPFFDQWRGWVSGILTVKQERKP